MLYICIEFFMVLDFKVNVRLVVGMTINFFMSLNFILIRNLALRLLPEFPKSVFSIDIKIG